MTFNIFFFFFLFFISERELMRLERAGGSFGYTAEAPPASRAKSPSDDPTSSLAYLIYQQLHFTSSSHLLRPSSSLHSYQFLKLYLRLACAVLNLEG
jgi:hypothetical protein